MNYCFSVDDGAYSFTMTAQNQAPLYWDMMYYTTGVTQYVGK